MRILIVFFFATTLLPNQAQSQDVIRRQLLRIGTLLLLDGYELTHDLKFDKLRDDYSGSYTFTLQSDKKYKIVGVCDGDCHDLDFCLFDENGNEIECDRQADDKPVVDISPRWSGEFSLRVRMYDCRIDPCDFGIAVFGKYK